MRIGCANAVVALAALAAFAPAPAATGGELPPPIPPVVATVDRGLVKENPFVQCRDGGYSTRVGKRSVWTFADTCLSSGGVGGDQFIDNTLAGASSFDASNGLFLDLDLEDTDGVPVRFIPYTANELAFNAKHAPQGNEIALWAQDIVNDPARDRVLLFYGAVYRGGSIGYNGIGAGIAVADPQFRQVTRPVENLDPNVREPTYMWSALEQGYTGGSLVVGDMLYSYGPHGVGLRTHMRLARVPLADTLDKSRWTYWTGSAWSTTNGNQATVFVGGAAGNTIYWNAWLGEYMAVYQHFADSTVWYRVANHPEGPWSDEAAMFIGETGTDASYSAHAHPEFQEDGGRVQYISYVKNTGFLSQQLPLVKVTFGQPPGR